MRAKVSGVKKQVGAGIARYWTPAASGYAAGANIFYKPNWAANLESVGERGVPLVGAAGGLFKHLAKVSIFAAGGLEIEH
jgi:hypothetical protein